MDFIGNGRCIYNFIDILNRSKNSSIKSSVILNILEDLFKCDFIFISNTSLNYNGTYKTINQDFHYGIHGLIDTLKTNLNNNKDHIFKYSQTLNKPFIVNQKILDKEKDNVSSISLKSSGLKVGIAYHYKSNSHKGTYIAIGFKKYNIKIIENNLLLLYTLAPHISDYTLYQFTKKLLKNTLPLTLREKQIFNLFKNGNKPRLISETLFISERTVRFHLNNIVSKLNANNKTHAISIAFNLDII